LSNEDKKISVNKVNEWTDNSLLKEIIKDSIVFDQSEKDQLIQILEKNFLKTLKQWRDLTEEQKKEFPIGLQSTLNNVSGKNNKIIK